MEAVSFVRSEPLQELTMTTNRTLRCTDHRGNRTETTEQIHRRKIWLGFIKWRLCLAFLLIRMDNSTK
ncbi:hypothetical protein [Xanthomonas albilineans]|uniref:hypothetical protein n=1 Tax=Xanthomonas albilineans TaxID=29447 RepID=UPI00126A083D|nr:hypothetical protein [Xanthomonas albilineans]